MPIDKISGVSFTGIDDLSGVAVSSIEKVSGIDAPSASADIVFSDITESTFDAPFGVQSYKVALPSSAQSGDFVMLLFCVDIVNESSNKVNTPTGWTLRVSEGDSGSDNWIYMFTRNFDGTESSVVQMTADFGGVSQNRGAVAFTFICENINTTNPVGSSATTTDSGGSNMTVPSATSSGAGTFMVFVGFDGADGEPITMTNNGGFTLTVGADAAAGPAGRGRHATAEWRYANINASTATGTTSVGFNTSDGKAGMTVTLQRA